MGLFSYLLAKVESNQRGIPGMTARHQLITMDRIAVFLLCRLLLYCIGRLMANILSNIRAAKPRCYHRRCATWM